MRGAEAVLSKTKIIGIPAVKKDRIRKTYRIEGLDISLRKKRTRREARLLHRAKIAGVKCPTVLEVSEFSLILSLIKGKRPKMDKKLSRKAGKLLALLHEKDIIHGDFTPANLIMTGNDLYVIDFGLGFFSSDVEDKAIDVLTMLKTIDTGKEFIAGYKKYKKSLSVLKRVEEVRKRARYA